MAEVLTTPAVTPLGDNYEHISAGRDVIIFTQSGHSNTAQQDPPIITLPERPGFPWKPTLIVAGSLLLLVLVGVGVTRWLFPSLVTSTSPPSAGPPSVSQLRQQLTDAPDNAASQILKALAAEAGTERRAANKVLVEVGLNKKTGEVQKASLQILDDRIASNDEEANYYVMQSLAEFHNRTINQQYRSDIEMAFEGKWDSDPASIEKTLTRGDLPHELANLLAIKLAEQAPKQESARALLERVAHGSVDNSGKRECQKQIGILGPG